MNIIKKDFQFINIGLEIFIQENGKIIREMAREWKDNMIYGKGVKTNKTDESTYEGEFKEDKK